MYTKKELARAAGIIRRIAREHGVPEAQVRSDMEEAINVGRMNPHPAVRAKWAGFHYTGAAPTAEEFILWAASQVGRG